MIGYGAKKRKSAYNEEKNEFVTGKRRHEKFETNDK
jgi:hypothetical protein